MQAMRSSHREIRIKLQIIRQKYGIDSRNKNKYDFYNTMKTKLSKIKKMAPCIYLKDQFEKNYD